MRSEITKNVFRSIPKYTLRRTFLTYITKWIVFLGLCLYVSCRKEHVGTFWRFLNQDVSLRCLLLFRFLYFLGIFEHIRTLICLTKKIIIVLNVIKKTSFLSRFFRLRFFLIKHVIISLNVIEWSWLRWFFRLRFFTKYVIVLSLIKKTPLSRQRYFPEWIGVLRSKDIWKLAFFDYRSFLWSFFLLFLSKYVSFCLFIIIIENIVCFLLILSISLCCSKKIRFVILKEWDFRDGSLIISFKLWLLLLWSK